MKTALILIVLFPSLIFAQEFEKERKIHFGLTTQFVASSIQQPGVNLMAFGEYKKHQVAFGQRLSYAQNRYYNDPNISSKKSSTVILDFHYRYFLLDRNARFNTFLQFSAEFYKRKDDVNFFYDPEYSGPEIDASSYQPAFGPVFDYSFNGTTNAKGFTTGIYLGIGEEIKITKGLFATANLGFGKLVGSSEQIITDNDLGAVVYTQESNGYWSQNIAMTFSAGLGYRF